MEVELHSSKDLTAALAEETERLTLAYLPVMRSLAGIHYTNVCVYIYIKSHIFTFILTIAYVPVMRSLSGTHYTNGCVHVYTKSHTFTLIYSCTFWHVFLVYTYTNICVNVYIKPHRSTFIKLCTFESLVEFIRQV